jgi:mRNA interferase MazF
MNRGEVWLVQLDPTRGQEIQKTRPAVIISQASIRSLAVRVVVPLTGWQPHFEGRVWIVRVEASPENGHSKTSGANALHIRSVSTDRLLKRPGVLTAQEFVNIVAAIGLAIDHP